jgi:AcrR family transcriptional regulator
MSGGEHEVRPAESSVSRRKASRALAHPAAVTPVRTRAHPDSRGELIAAAQRVIRERGADAVSVEELTALAGVSSGAFRASFADRTDLLVTVFDEAVEQLRTRLLGAYSGAGSWADGVRGALFELLFFLDAEPNRARFLVVGSLAGDPPMRTRRAHLLRELAEGLESQRPAGEPDALEAPFGADAVVGAVAAIVHGRLLEDPVPPLQSLGGSLMAVIVLPYLGADAARSELSRQAPQDPGRAGTPERAPSDRRPLRVTVRTLAVLDAIAQRPGLDRRAVAEAAGIADAAQCSRILARLERLGAIAATEPTPQRDNAWRITDIGRQVLTEVGPQSHG